MTSPMKKQKKKTVQGQAGEGFLLEDFDYSNLIPKDLDEKTKEIMEKFFRNEDVPAKDRTEAIDTFLMAVKKEHNAVEKAEQETEKESKQSQDDFELSPNSLSEERQRINVGWMTSRVDCDDSTDEKIAQFCQRLGVQLYNFVSYPVGGVKRAFWSPQKNEDGVYSPSSIWLPDIQLQHHLWVTYVNGYISPWIDCDSDDPELASLSESEIIKELNYASYLGIRSVVITLRRMNSPKLAAVINKWLWTRSTFVSLWVFVPTSTSRFIDQVENKDCWEVWADFRSQCSNFGAHKLNVGLEISDSLDDEFTDNQRVSRWLSEPLGVFLIEAGAFSTCPKSSQAVLSASHEALLRRLWTTDTLRILVRGSQESESPDHRKLEFSTSLRNAVKDIEQPKIGASFLQHVEYFDVLQTPLQPLADNLDSGVYNTFEQDRVKYDSYQAAIEACLVDMADTRDKPETLVLFVLGAGRGPLMNAAIQAERNFNEKYRGKKNRLQMQLFVVEKNPNALTTLHYVNKVAWRNRVTVIEADMRKLHENEKFLACPKPDIIVSELLGSFGDNELSPECLDGITFFLKPTTVSIPSSYTSYVAPIMSCYLHQNMRACVSSYWNKGISGVGREDLIRERDGSFSQVYNTTREDSNLDQLYVVYLRHYCPLGDAKPVFTFNHPNFENSSNEREERITLDSFAMPADLMGFAGYFSLVLYKDIVISIEPKTHTRQMYSWFSAIIPLRKLERVYPGDKVTLDIKRKVDSGGVWYEWFAEIEGKDKVIRKTVLQNGNGVNNYLRFFDTGVTEA